MPGIKDIVLASLIEKDPPENPKIYSHTTNQGKLDNTQSLVPPELIEEYDNEFRSYFGEAMEVDNSLEVDNSKIILSSTFFSVKCTEVNRQIFQEHNYCKNQSKA
ncbi:MAG: hypothetical protein RLY40_883 [Pseudomonadota bacterium]|jgi:hypothetical protein